MGGGGRCAVVFVVAAGLVLSGAATFTLTLTLTFVLLILNLRCLNVISAVFSFVFS